MENHRIYPNSGLRSNFENTIFMVITSENFVMTKDGKLEAIPIAQ